MHCPILGKTFSQSRMKQKMSMVISVLTDNGVRTASSRAQPPPLQAEFLPAKSYLLAVALLIKVELQAHQQIKALIAVDARYPIITNTLQPFEEDIEVSPVIFPTLFTGVQAFAMPNTSSRWEPPDGKGHKGEYPPVHSYSYS